MRNNLKTLVFLASLSAIFIFFGGLLAGRQGVFFGFLFAVVTNFIAYWFSDKIVLQMHHAQEIFEGDELGLYNVVVRLSQKAQIPMPKVYLIPDHSPNAFATGRDPYHSAVAVTQGLIGLLNSNELEGVLAHELAHIKNRDTLISCIAATMASAIMFLANIIKWSALFGSADRHNDEETQTSAPALFLMAILAPIAASLIQFAISRSREFLADEAGAKICGHPEWLANALRKIHNMSVNLPLGTGGPATAHLYIVNPFSAGAILNLFSTHPPVEDRISKLLNQS